MKTAEQVMAAIADRGALPDALALATHYGTTVLLVAGKNHDPRAARAREALWFHLQKHLRLSHAELGEMFGRHRTTILCGIRAHEQRQRFDAARIDERGADR